MWQLWEGDFVLYEDFANNIKKQELLLPKQRVIVACSGGADSLCLLHLMQRFVAQEGGEIIVCHVNHQLRGNDSKEDARVVETYCQNNELIFALEHVDVKAWAMQQSLSIETAARQLRYAALRAVKLKYAAEIIITAHTKNDQAETFFLNMLRGAGLSGLKGILPKQKDLLRPLLGVSRPEIETYCRIHKLIYCQDKSNEQLEYLRNSVRKELIPYIKNKYNPKIIEVLGRNIQLLQIEDDYMQKQAELIGAQIIKQEQVVMIKRQELASLHKAIFLRVVLLAVEKLKGDKQGLGNVHLEAIYNLVQVKATGKTIELPGKIWAKLQYENLVLQLAKPLENVANDQEIILEKAGKYDFYGKIFMVTMQKELPTIEKNNILCLPFVPNVTKIKIRTRRVGDKINIVNVGRKKLKEFFIEQKIDSFKRDSIPLVEYNGQVVWVVGHRKFTVDFVDNAGKSSYIIIEYIQ